MFTQDLADEICIRIAEGESLRKICDDAHMPTRVSVWRWLRDNPEFSSQYAHAREDQAEHYADEIIEIADTDEDSNRARVRIDARKWKASKMDRRRFGDAMTTTLQGKDGGPIETKSVGDTELARRLVFILEKAANAG